MGKGLLEGGDEGFGQNEAPVGEGAGTFLGKVGASDLGVGK